MKFLKGHSRGFNQAFSYKMLMGSLFVLGGVGVGCGGAMQGKGGASTFLKTGSQADVVLQCGPPLQSHQYLQPLPKNQNEIHVIYKELEFSDEEAAKIRSVIETWNDLHRKLYGENLFVLKVDRESEHTPVSSLNNCDFNGDSGEIIIARARDDAEWKAAGFPSNSPGLTIRCSIEGEGLQKQIVLLGADNGRIGGREQFESVFLHEMGHAIGLDHSCDMSGDPNRVKCDELDRDHSYRDAVMFPYLMVNEGNRTAGIPPSAEVKEALRRNDEARSECVLQSR